jgi:hypothetical protein
LHAAEAGEGELPGRIVGGGRVEGDHADASGAVVGHLVEPLAAGGAGRGVHVRQERVAVLRLHRHALLVQRIAEVAGDHGRVRQRARDGRARFRRRRRWRRRLRRHQHHHQRQQTHSHHGHSHSHTQISHKSLFPHLSLARTSPPHLQPVSRSSSHLLLPKPTTANNLSDPQAPNRAHKTIGDPSRTHHQNCASPTSLTQQYSPTNSHLPLSQWPQNLRGAHPTDRARSSHLSSICLTQQAQFKPIVG